MNDLHIAIVQAPLVWENIADNLQAFEQRITAIQEAVDLIVLPEMFSTGFTMNSSQMAEEMDGSAVEWMKKIAAEKGGSIAGSLIIREKGNFYNRLVYARPDGHVNWYDKRHLFRMADEHDYFAAGKDKTIVEESGWKINLQVCYDLRFPVWSRNSYIKTKEEAQAAYDVLVYVANWPKARINAWDSLLTARAIENQCYVIGVNRVGVDGKQIEYNGHSRVVDPKGNAMIKLEEAAEETAVVRLSWDELADFRKKFPVGLDAD